MLDELIGVGEAKTLIVCEFDSGTGEETRAGLELEGCSIAFDIGGSKWGLDS